MGENTHGFALPESLIDVGAWQYPSTYFMSTCLMHVVSSISHKIKYSQTIGKLRPILNSRSRIQSYRYSLVTQA